MKLGSVTFFILLTYSPLIVVQLTLFVSNLSTSDNVQIDIDSPSIVDVSELEIISNIERYVTFKARAS